MKKSILYITSVLVGAVALSGCKKETPAAYENDPRLYFYHYDNRNYGENLTQTDRIDHSFVEVPASEDRDTVWVLMQTMGDVADFDRPVNLSQVNTGEAFAAVAGVHYEPFTNLSELMIIPAGAARHYIPVVLLRDSSLETDTYALVLKIEENAFFKAGIPEYQEFTVTTTDVLTKPTNWDTLWKNYFGISWGPVKMQFLIDYVTGPIDWLTYNREVDGTTLIYLRDLAPVQLEAVNERRTAAGLGLLAEADGTIVRVDE